MAKYLIGLLTLLEIGCGGQATSDSGTNSSIDSSELAYKKGDCVAFKIDSLTYGVGIVFDIINDEGGLWYSLLFTDYESQDKPELKSIKNKRLLGRKVQSSRNGQGVEIWLDGEYVSNKLISNCLRVGNLELNDKARLGTYGASSEISSLVISFTAAQDRRRSPPNDYQDYINKLNGLTPDEYFDLKDFLKH